MEKKLYELINDSVVTPSIFNQALMELGATVCMPNGAPHCEKCPWGELCEARKQNRIGELPVKKKAKARRIEEKTVLIIKDGEQIALHKRAEEGLLAGLYELPNTNGHLTEMEVLEYIRVQGYEPVRILPTCEAKHIFSHVEWHMKGYVVFLEAKDMDVSFSQEELFEKEEWIFVEVEDTKEKYAIPSAFSKYAKYLNLVIGKDAVKKTEAHS